MFLRPNPAVNSLGLALVYPAIGTGNDRPLTGCSLVIF